MHHKWHNIHTQERTKKYYRLDANMNTYKFNFLKSVSFNVVFKGDVEVFIDGTKKQVLASAKVTLINMFFHEETLS